MFSSENILIGIVYKVEKVIDVNIWGISGYYGSKGYGLDEMYLIFVYLSFGRA